MNISSNIQLVLDILQNEVDGDVNAALEKMSEDYSMTWMYESEKQGLFPSSGKDIEGEVREIYEIKGRKYDIRNIAEAEDLVMVEMIESYPDPKTSTIYHTPQVIVLELEDGKIKKGRHYTDPRVSFRDLTTTQIEHDGLKGTSTKLVID